MLRIYLCDDQMVFLEKYKSLIEQFARAHHFDVSISTFLSGEQLLFLYEDPQEEPDIIFLDILMDDENGLDIAKILRDKKCTSEIVFLTVSQEHVFDAFDVSPAAYILKDSTSNQRFDEILTRVFATAARKPSRLFTCENGHTTQSMPLSSIIYFEVSNRLVTIHYGTETFSFYSTLEHVAQNLDSPFFIRVHRSFLVNLQYVRQMDHATLTLNGGECIPIGVTYSKKVKEALNHYYSHL